MAGTPKRLFGPLALTTTYTTNVYQGAGGSALIYDVLTHIHIANKANADTFRLYLGATGANAAGTELWYDYPIGAKLDFDRYPRMKLMSTDFLVGGAATTLTLVIEGEGEQFAV